MKADLEHIDRYELVEQLGERGAVSIWRARETSDPDGEITVEILAAEARSGDADAELKKRAEQRRATDPRAEIRVVEDPGTGALLVATRKGPPRLHVNGVGHANGVGKTNPAAVAREVIDDWGARVPAPRPLRWGSGLGMLIIVAVGAVFACIAAIGAALIHPSSAGQAAPTAEPSSTDDTFIIDISDSAAVPAPSNSH